MTDGSYQSFLKPQEVRDLEAQGERFFPRDLASLVREESSLLARKARLQAIEAGENVVIDSVLGSQKTADGGRTPLRLEQHLLRSHPGADLQPVQAQRRQPAAARPAHRAPARQTPARAR
jgi:hypothetical protein